MENSNKIRKLEENVINRIAAGEIIQQPANALKELIENSLDAKSTNIQIIVKNGGLKLLQITDNGCGINKDDFGIVCERFTTSKLREFNDLQKISTFGFRGEALASISHVAHLTITSKVPDEICAYKANYIDGELDGAPKPIAGNQGTTITVEDLFYNMKVRRNTLRSPAEEYQKITEVVSKYAVHNPTVGFALKKADGPNDIRTPPNSNAIENIKIIYGSSIAKELVEFNVESDTYKFKLSGQISTANYSMKKIVFLLFINNRLVDCQSLKRKIDEIYGTYLPKNMHPFIYLALELDPMTLDVNVHPTKHEVHFLNEDQIVESICTNLETKLLSMNSSRTFYIQAKLPDIEMDVLPLRDHDKTVQQKDLVRTDANEQKLEKFFNTTKTEDEENLNESHSEKIRAIAKISRTPTELTSVLQMRTSIESECNHQLRTIFAQHVFVGSISPGQSLIQYSTKLFICNTTRIIEELFYQLIIYNFENIDYISFNNPPTVYELALIGMDMPETGWTEEDGDKTELARNVFSLLQSKREMLKSYFSLDIDDEGQLMALPLILDNYEPDKSQLPLYLIRLATEVDWDTEKECFDTFARETAFYYAKMFEHTTCSGNDWKWITEHVIYPAIKSYLIPPKKFIDNPVLYEIANLPNLYKVFERC